jgi:hypothetical protein
MRSLALGVTITDEHTRLARLETDASLHAALGAAVGRRNVTIIIHFRFNHRAVEISRADHFGGVELAITQGMMRAFFRRSPWRIFGSFTTARLTMGGSSTSGTDLLFDTWSTATECMINVPGASHLSSTEGVLYMTPVPPPPPTMDDDNKQAVTADAGTNIPWPTIFVDNILFSLTAYNPMGNTVSHDVNVKANIALEQDILQLYNNNTNSRGDDNDNNSNNNSSGGVPLIAWWHSFGFHEQEGWRENGYTLAFPVNDYGDSDSDSASETVMKLANKYHQAAIYKFSYEHGVVIRQVVHVVDNPNADDQQKQQQSSKDVMMIVTKPPSALADRYWSPSSSRLQSNSCDEVTD